MSGEAGFAEQHESRPEAAAVPDHRLDRETTQVVLRRAFEIAHREPQNDLVFSRSTLAEIATEVDLPVHAVAAALAERLADGTDDQSFLDRMIGSDRVSVHRRATAPENDMRQRAVRLLETGHGMRPRVQQDGVVIATKRKDLLGKLASTLRDAQGLGQLGKLRRVEVAAVDIGDEPGAIVVSADIGDRRTVAIVGGTAVGALGGLAIAGGVIALGPVAVVGAPVAAAVGFATSRVAFAAAEREVREDLEEAADALVRGDEPDGLIGRSARRVWDSLRSVGRPRTR